MKKKDEKEKGFSFNKTLVLFHTDYFGFVINRDFYSLYKEVTK
jgi:hypothetical protein